MISLDEVRDAIERSGADWIAGDTETARLSDDQFRRRLGAVPGPNDPSLQEREWVARVNAASPMAGTPRLAAPARWDWRDVGGRNFVTPVRNQGGCGSCVSFGTVSTLESQLRIDLDTPDLDVNCSEAHLHFCHLGLACETGTWPANALTAVLLDGVTDERCYPYVDQDQPCGACGDSASRLTFISAWRRFVNPDSMRNWMSENGPLIACFSVYQDFRRHTGGIYRHVTGDFLGGHCVSVIGYDHDGGYWLCKNSWGPGAGNQDIFQIAYGECGIDSEMWTVEGPRGWGALDDATFVRQSTPPVAVPGQPYGTTVVMRNTGLQTWTAGRGYRLISQSPEGNTAWGVGEMTVSAPVAPWTDATFSLDLTAPAEPTHLQWRMYRAEAGSFGQSTPDITPAAGPVPIRQGMVVKMRHQATGCALHSHRIPYSHPGTSGQQQVTCFAGGDDNDLWMLKGPHGQNTPQTYGQQIKHGDVVRLEHVATGRNLHSHGGISSPLTGQQEVTAFGINGNGDFNDNWCVEVDGAGPWTTDRAVRLIHVATGVALHSHAGWSDPVFTTGQQEVTGFAGRDSNDFWYASDLRGLDARFQGQTVPEHVVVGTPQQASVTMVNTGTESWSANRGVRLGSQSPQDNQVWGLSRVELPADVPPGDAVTFGFAIAATAGGARRPFQWRMVRDGVAWFGDLGARTDVPIFTPNVDIVVVPAVMWNPPGVASEMIRAAGLIPLTYGESGRETEVDDQSPAQGTPVARGSTVRLHVSKTRD